MGWRVVGDFPDEPKLVVVVAPHTNWVDLFLSVAGKWYFGVSGRYLAKDALFRVPVLRQFLQLTGGLSVDRSSAHGVTEQVAEVIRAADEITLGVAAEGTRHLTKHWRSGFYHIARAAGVPVLLVAFDGGKREVVVGPVLHLSGDMARDMDKVRAFYKDVTPIYPERFGPVRLRSEQEPS